MKIKEDAINLYNFLLSPKNYGLVEDKNIFGTIKLLLRLYLIETLTLLIIMPFILLLADTSTNVISDIKGQNTGIRSFLLIVLLVPLVEELIFRLPLIFRPIFLGISSGAIALMLSGQLFAAQEIMSAGLTILCQISISILIAFVIYYLCLKKYDIIQRFYSKYLNYLVWFTILSFAFLHILNFNITDKNLILLPFLTLTQLVGGLIMAYSRLRFGFVFAVGYHASCNLVVWLIA